MIWYKEKNPEIIVSTRVRLARNLADFPFPNALLNKKEVTDKIKAAIFNSNSTLSSDFEDADFESISSAERIRLSEKHLVSPEMANKKDSACLINKDKTMSIMIMEEDHIREQVILGGYKLDEAYDICNKVDDVLSENLEFAFNENLGYLTACPTNIGTGMRASVMMHLPALSLTGKMDRIISSARNVGITVRGFYGEGTKADGYFYQISNTITTGASETEIIQRVKNVVDQILNFEKESREKILKDNKNEIEDRVYRSYGALKYARKISSDEAIKLISDVLLGKNMGIIKEESVIPIMELIVGISPAHIGQNELTADERDLSRSEMIRNNI